MRSQFVENKKKMPVLGVGLGYRPEIADQTLENRGKIDFLEVISENYIKAGVVQRNNLARAEAFQIIPHGVELSIGSTGEIDYEHLKGLKKFLHEIKAPWWSDHLCFTGADHNRLHDLLPLPFSKEAVTHVANRVRKIQEFMEIPFLLENISAYLTVPGSEMTEAQFIAEVLEEADCGMLLDVNNVYVNSYNMKFDPFAFVDQLPIDRVVQIHIAGHRKVKSIIVDTHGAQIIQPVYDILAHVLQKTDVKGILLERDQLFPKFDNILSELERIREVARKEQPQLVEFVAPVNNNHAPAVVK